MKVFKFGGASLKDAESVKNVVRIVEKHKKQDLIIIASAMGKMTNAFEKLIAEFRGQTSGVAKELESIRKYHTDIISKLEFSSDDVHQHFESHFRKLELYLEGMPADDYDFDYDQLVVFGELFSTTILSAYLNSKGHANQWTDARTLIRTNNVYREANVQWEKTEELCQRAWNSCKENGMKILLTQGFMGHTRERNTTTLGREGSDFSAAILAYSLNADSVTIWKDVPGVLNADPKYFSEAVRLPRISYKEAIELAYYGASVIHPKTIKPLQNKKIDLFVKSFLDMDAPGTQIDSSTFSDSLVPSYIFKVDQILVSFTPRDFSFIAEDNLSELFGLFAAHRLKIHLMQNSAINFSICADYDKQKLDAILQSCKENYEVLYNTGCELVTIRHYDQETISRLLIGKKVLVEQKSRSTVRMVLQDA